MLGTSIYNNSAHDIYGIVLLYYTGDDMNYCYMCQTKIPSEFSLCFDCAEPRHTKSQSSFGTTTEGSAERSAAIDGGGADDRPLDNIFKTQIVSLDKKDSWIMESPLGPWEVYTKSEHEEIAIGNLINYMIKDPHSPNPNLVKTLADGQRWDEIVGKTLGIKQCYDCNYPNLVAADHCYDCGKIFKMVDKNDTVISLLKRIVTVLEGKPFERGC